MRTVTGSSTSAGSLTIDDDRALAGHVARYQTIYNEQRPHDAICLALPPLPALVCLIGERDEVSDVLGRHRPLFPLSRGEHGRVRQGAQLAALSHRDDIVTANTKLLRDRRR
jgi:hypothetical protein